jgi:carbonic anhydrase/acetyltransferase-like protein (isoleucine patch superfamily)
MLVTASVSLGLAATWACLTDLPLGDFRGIAWVATGLLFSYASIIACHRLVLIGLPIREGVVKGGTREEFGYHLYALFHLFFFFPLTRSGLFPIPCMRIVHQLLGARLGANTFSGGIIMDPLLTVIGSNTIVGQGALVVSHNMVGRRLIHAVTRIGDDVTIGGRVIVAAGAEIGDEAVVMLGAIVAPFARVGRRARIGAGAIVGAGAVVGECAVVAPAVHVPAGTRIPPGARWPGRQGAAARNAPPPREAAVCTKADGEAWIQETTLIATRDGHGWSKPDGGRVEHGLGRTATG